MRYRKFTTLGAVMVAACVQFACSGTTGETGSPPKFQSEASLRPAQSCQSVRQQVVDATTEQVLKRRYRERRAVAGAEGGADRSAGDSSSSNSTDSPDDYTETNTQEEGVDETDIVKTDGDYIYTVDGNELVILESWPAEQTTIEGRYEVGAEVDRDRRGRRDDHRNVEAQSLFLKGDKVAVFSSISESLDGNSSFRDHFWGTRITILDVSDRANPSLIEQLDVEGSMVSGRMIDGDVYLVSRSDMTLPFNTWELANTDDDRLPPREWGLSEEERQKRVEEARPVVRQMVEKKLDDRDISELFPRRRLFDDQGDLVWSESMYDCRDLYLPQQTAQLGVLNVSHFDFDTPEKIATTGLLADGWTVYSSKKNLYVAMSSRLWFWGWGWNNQDEESHIHKFSLDGAGNRPRYTASGKVDGWLLDQFSMDEHDGYLRVASTESGTRWGVPEDEQEQSKNHITVLDQKGHTLKEVGSVRGLAPGERIYAVRMMGDKGYVVTFRQIDPLFTLDLSNPTDPKVKGELKITGFSSYMHPLGKGHLMTIGKDADQDGNIQGVHLQIFDVSDMENPERVHQEKISTGQWSSWSEAMWNHHAFTYHPEREVLAFPVNIRDWDRLGGENFSGLLVYEANAKDGFSPIGRVDHSGLGSGHNDWWTSVRRSIFIEDYVYSLSERGLKVNDLRQPENERAAVAF